MARYRLTVEYDGAAYSGWQTQQNARSVQQALEQAIARIDPSAPRVAGAGRTDAGVHARGQVAHVDLARAWVGWKLRAAINAHLVDETVGVVEASPADDGFDARRSAVARHYRYVVVNRRSPLVFERGRAWLVRKPLDIPAMREAAQVMIGRHDFSTFRDSQCQANSPLRTLDYFCVEAAHAAMEISRPRHPRESGDLRVSLRETLGAGRRALPLDPRFRGDDGSGSIPSATTETIHFDVGARSFLHRQVRSMVGSLVEVGLGKWSVADFRAAFEAADRSRCGPVAPPGGLYLMRVDYPEK